MVKIIASMFLMAFCSCSLLFPANEMSRHLVYQVEKEHKCALYDIRIVNGSGGDSKKKKFFVSACGKKLIYVCERTSDSLLECKQVEN